MPDEHRLRDGEFGYVRVGGGDNGVELRMRHRRSRVARPLTGAIEERGIRFDDGDLEPGEPKRRRVDAGEVELEHAGGRLAERLEDPRRRGGCEGRWQPHVSRSTAIAQIPSSAAPSVNTAVTVVEPWRSDAVCQMPGSARSPRARTC